MSDLDDDEYKATRKIYEDRPHLIGGITITPRMTPREIEEEVKRLMEKKKANGEEFSKSEIHEILNAYKNCRIEEEER